MTDGRDQERNGAQVRRKQTLFLLTAIKRHKKIVHISKQQMYFKIFVALSGTFAHQFDVPLF